MPGLNDFVAHQFNPRRVISKAAAYTVLVTDEEVRMTGATARTFTLPGMDGLGSITNKFKAYKFVNDGTANLTIDAGDRGDTAEAQTINSKSALIVRPGQSVILQGKPYGTDWEIIYPSPWPAMTECIVPLIATTSGTTAVNLVDADGAPAAGNILAVLTIADDTNAGNVVVKNGTNTVATVAKSTTAGLPVGATSGGVSNAAVTAGNVLTVESSTTNGNARVIVWMATQAYA